MSNAIVPVVPKRNATTGAGYPTALVLGELAVNTTTGDVYLGADPGVVQIGVALAAGTYLNLGTGDGTQTEFAVTGGTGTAAGGYIVSVGGIDQPSGWSVVGTTLTFTEPPPAGAEVSIRAILKGVGTGGGGSTNATQLQGRNIASTAPVDGQLLAWNATANEWRPFGHMYPHGTYWSDDETLVNGSYLFISPLLNTPAANVNFMEGTNNITTNGVGLVTVTDVNWYLDSSSYARSVTKNGSITQGNDAGSAKYANFDGQSGYFHTDAIPLGTGDLTIELFVNHSTPDYNLGVFVNGGDGGIQFGHDASSEILYLGLANIVNTIFVSANITNSWHHVAYVRSGTTGTMYVDGLSIATATDENDYGFPNVDIGAFLAYGASNRYFKGKMAGLRITNTAVYTDNFTVPTTLPTNITGTQLLLNFGATAVPTV